MAPKKRQRTMGTNNKTSNMAPETLSEVCPARIQLKDWIVQCYQGRHGHEEPRKFPIERGGSFLDIVQRCWGDEESLMETSFDFVKKIGILAADASEQDFLDKFLTMKD